MATKEFYHDIDLVKVGSLLNARFQNLDNTAMAALAATLSGANKGLTIYNTEQEKLFVWDGAEFDSVSGLVAGAMTFKGVVAFDATEPVAPATGDTYIFSTAGTNTWEGSTVVEIGDSAIWNGTAWNFLQANVVASSETVAGVIELATQTEVNTGTDPNRAVTPATLTGKLSNYAAAKVYFASSVNVSADTPFTVNHNLALQNRNSFTINVMDSSHSAVNVDVDSVNTNSLTITSSVALTGLSVSVIGF